MPTCKMCCNASRRLRTRCAMAAGSATRASRFATSSTSVSAARTWARKWRAWPCAPTPTRAWKCTLFPTSTVTTWKRPCPRSIRKRPCSSWLRKLLLRQKPCSTPTRRAPGSCSKAKKRIWPSISWPSRPTRKPSSTSAFRRTICSRSGTGWAAAIPSGRRSAWPWPCPSVLNTSAISSPARMRWTSISARPRWNRTCPSCWPWSVSGTASSSIAAPFPSRRITRT
ncbi:hypothetical protein D3C72_1494380 [compost metagenome]